MARYRIVNPELRVIAAGKQNAGKKYLYAMLQNTNCIWETPQVFTSFNQLMVQAFEKLLPIDKGGVAQEAQTIPDEFQYITGCWVDWEPKQKFYKVHLTNHPAVPPTPTNPRGRDAIKAGELVSRGGIPIVYDKLRVFCLYYLDEFNERNWQDGESPMEVGERAFRNYCIPVSEDKTPQRINSGNPPEAPAPQMPQQPVMQPQQTVQQPVQPQAQPQAAPVNPQQAAQYAPF